MRIIETMVREILFTIVPAGRFTTRVQPCQCSSTQSGSNTTSRQCSVFKLRVSSKDRNLGCYDNACETKHFNPNFA